MCLILLAWNTHPDYSLIFAANRDEFRNRPTASLGFWSDHPHILAGRDLRAGGTWCGLHRNGRFAAVTNIRRRPLEAGKRSRGDLVKDFLVGHDPPTVWAETRLMADYGGVNLLMGSLNPQNPYLYFLSSNHDLRPLPSGIYALSNASLDTPWPKVRRSREQFTQCLQRPFSPNDLFAILSDRNTPPDDELPDTGVGIAWERRLSPIFIDSPDYGTLAQTVWLIDRQFQAQVLEKTASQHTTLNLRIG